MKRPLRILSCCILPTLLLACSDAGIQPIDRSENIAVDDKLVITGDVCTDDPTSVFFPVKIMFIVDASGSMQFTDPSDANTVTTFGGGGTGSGAAGADCLNTCNSSGAGNCAALCANANSPGRQAAVQKVIDRFKNNPAVEFAIIRFNARVTVNGGEPGCDGFSNKDNCIRRGIDSLTQAEIFTDYQGALSSAFEILEKDMVDSSPIERIRTKYVIIFVSDGAPDPQCLDGCGNDEYLGQVNQMCDRPPEEWCDLLFQTGARCDFINQWFPSMAEPCKAYNDRGQIVQRVNEIMDLGETYSVGEIRLHAAFLFVPGLPKAILDLFDGDPTNPVPLEQRAEELLQEMAKAGDGLYRNFTSGQQIDFLDINYSSVARPFGMTNITLTNTNSWPESNTLGIDSDGDGVTDLAEFDANLTMSDSNRDSDGDGYNDKLELDRYGSGFHPGDAAIPAKQCVDRDDLDGDGLLGCEEKVIGTDPKLPDTDRDRIPDGIEFLWGTDPLRNDSKDDIDFDGKFSGEEINIHASPQVADPEIHADYRYIYDVREQPERPDRRQCYDFTVRNVRLVTTLGQAAGQQGMNEIMVYFGEGPADDPRDFGSFKAACLRAQYVKPNFKDPVDGKIHLSAADFMDLPALLKARENAKVDPTLDPCVGVKLQ